MNAWQPVVWIVAVCVLGAVTGETHRAQEATDWAQHRLAFALAFLGLACVIDFGLMQALQNAVAALWFAQGCGVCYALAMLLLTVRLTWEER